MTIVPPISAKEAYIASIRPRLMKAAEAATADFLQASKSENFNISEYAKKGVYDYTSAKLEGTTLGEKGASLKLLVHRFKNKSIFAIVKSGKVLGARGYLAEKNGIIRILDKLCQKGRMKEEEAKLAKKQLNWK